jgi:hypothetical protein
VDLGIWTSGFSLQLPDLSIGIFIRVIGHFWHQGRVIEGFIFPLERDILQLESLAFRSACIDLHFLFSLWRHYFVLREHFVAAHIYCLYGHLKFMPDQPSIVLILHCS